MRNILTEVTNAILSGAPCAEDITPFGYRVLRGKSDKDFETMTDTPMSRRVIFISPLTKDIFGKTAYQIMKDIVGYPAEDIKSYLEGGTKFKICLFYLEGNDAIKRALWPEVVEVMQEAYPDINFFGDKNGPNKKLIQALASVPFSAYEAMFGGPGSFSRIKKAGHTGPAFITETKLKAMQDMERVHGTAIITPAIIRLFMYLSCNFNPQFGGYGYTVNDEGIPGVPEYLMANKPLKELGHYELRDLNVVIP